MKVGDLCGRKPVTVSVAAPVSDAARLMCEEDVGAVVVTAAPSEQPIPVGMLTDRDIVCAQLDRAVDLGQLRIGDIMTADPLVLNEDAPVERAIHLLRNRRVRRAPVVDGAGTLVGIVTLDDLLPAIAQQLNELAATVAPRSGPLTSHERLT